MNINASLQKTTLIAVTLTFLTSCASNSLVACLSETLCNIETVHERFRASGIENGFVQIDADNRLILKGEYKSDAEVDKAFSIAQTVTGVRHVSPVTPNSIKVKQWAMNLSSAMSNRFKAKNTAFTKPPSFNSKPPSTVANRYALVVGVSNFKNTKIHSLNYATKDATDVKNYLLDTHGGRFSNVTFLLNEQATRANIQNALAELENKANENDLVFLYFSTHGSPPDKNGSVAVVTYDTEVKPRERIWQTALNEEIIKKFVQNIKSKRLVVVLDTCYSGGAYRQVEGFLASGSKALEDDEESYNVGRSSQDMEQRLLGAKDLVLDEPIPQTPQKWGKMLVSASNGGEKSWEPSGEAEVSNINNSFFTHYFIEGMQKNNGDVRQAFNYAQPAVVNVVEKVKHNAQHPQLTSFYPNADVIIY